MRIASRQRSDERRLAEIDEMLAVLPESIDLRFQRACCLEDLGWDEPASRTYLAVLEREPSHLGARVNLGSMLRERGELTAAHAHHTLAVEHHPLEAVARTNLAKTLLEADDVTGALRQYAAALALDPDSFDAHHGRALAFERVGDLANAQLHFARAFADRAWWRQPASGDVELRALVLVSGRGGDVVWHPFFDARTTDVTTLVPEGVREGAALPEHDVVFNAIGDADRCAPALARARALVADERSAIVNHPQRVAATGRLAVAARLGAISGVVTPLIERVPRAALEGGRLAARGWAFPLLLRSPGFHAGRNFVAVSGSDELAAAVARLPGDELYVLAYVDTAGPDGAYRKYRVMMVDGTLYPAHLAIAHDWNVHYFSAPMAERSDYREEERQFLADMSHAVGPRAMDALQAIATELGLDYGGIDFAIDAAGNVVVFEANATMAVAPPEPDPRWAYRRPAYDAIVAAVRAMLRRFADR